MKMIIKFNGKNSKKTWKYFFGIWIRIKWNGSALFLVYIMYIEELYFTLYNCTRGANLPEEVYRGLMKRNSDRGENHQVQQDSEHEGDQVQE